MTTGEKIAKFLASTGLGSRRYAEQIVKDGRVIINGKVNSNVATRVCSQSDHVLVDNVLVSKLVPRMWLVIKHNSININTTAYFL